ncbi:MAG: cytochrome c [Pseudomonadota bacterium]
MAPKRIVAALFVALIVVIGIAGIAIYSGSYNIAADAPHTSPVLWLLNNVRDRAIIAHAAGITAPSNLEDPTRISAGAGLYNEMCSGCHLGPGVERSEISQGLYPRAPELAHGTDLSPEQEFWVIKHGVKLTGMAAWGPTHSDALIWDMVAFLRKLPSFSASQYQATVKSAPADHDEMMKGMRMENGDKK